VTQEEDAEAERLRVLLIAYHRVKLDMGNSGATKDVLLALQRQHQQLSDKFWSLVGVPEFLSSPEEAAGSQR
jgi:hypothetical protein